MEMTDVLSGKKMAVTLSLVALNLIVGSLVSLLRLPIFLDSIGIVSAAILLGVEYGVACAVLTCMIGFFVINPYLLAFTGTAVAVALTAHVLRKKNLFSTYPKVLFSGLVIAVVAALVSAPVKAYLFQGSTLSGTDVVTAYFLSAGHGILESVTLAGLLTEPVDKVLVALITFQILKSFPSSFFSRHGFRSYKD